MMYNKPKRVKIPEGYLGYKSGVALGTNGIHYFIRLDGYNGYEDDYMENGEELGLDFHYLTVESVVLVPDEVFTDEEYKEFFV